MPTPKPPSFFELTRDEQKELLQGAAYRTLEHEDARDASMGRLYDLNAQSQRFDHVDQANTERETLRLVLRAKHAH